MNDNYDAYKEIAGCNLPPPFLHPSLYILGMLEDFQSKMLFTKSRPNNVKTFSRIFLLLLSAFRLLPEEVFVCTIIGETIAEHIVAIAKAWRLHVATHIRKTFVHSMHADCWLSCPFCGTRSQLFWSHFHSSRSARPWSSYAHDNRNGKSKQIYWQFTHIHGHFVEVCCAIVRFGMHPRSLYAILHIYFLYDTCVNLSGYNSILMSIAINSSYCNEDRTG